MAYEYVLGIIIGVILLGIGLRMEQNSVPAGGPIKLGMILIGITLAIWGAVVAWTVLFPG